jgi:hypothetical protein
VIPDEAVEAAARAMALATIHGRFWSSYEWDSGVMSDRHKGPFRIAARAALEAAAPDLMAQAWAEGVQDTANQNALPEAWTTQMLEDNPYRAE